MKQSRLKYPTRIGGVLYPKHTIVELLDRNDPRVLEVWPNMEENRHSNCVCIIPPNSDVPCITLSEQIEEIE